MDEFLAPKEVNTGMDVLPEVVFSETGLEFSFSPLASLDDLAAWKEKQDSRRRRRRRRGESQTVFFFFLKEFVQKQH